MRKFRSLVQVRFRILIGEPLPRKHWFAYLSDTKSNVALYYIILQVML